MSTTFKEEINTEFDSLVRVTDSAVSLKILAYESLIAIIHGLSSDFRQLQIKNDKMEERQNNLKLKK